ncbi:ABC transporter permease [Vibrio cholerae]|uniref:ABC transporter permease n=1 Tax=Vibrio cholerae TaxID=666 RepID=UPI0022F347C4|nr:ABC transporter permease [Vibrio cholerae]MDA5315465.1 ABC transporter permease [Vibrio cholerae]MDN6972198.1 ABC transporter permease [Vibrio cholerae]
MKRVLLPLWAYRYFILSSIRTEFRSRFARSKLGGLWMVLNPLAMVLVYALILSQIMTAKLPEVSTQYAYPIYILSGVIGWTLFSEVLSRCLTVFIDNGNLLKKMSFPKLALPLTILGSSLVNFIMMLITMFVVFGFLGHLPFHALHWLPLLVLITLGLATGIGLFFGVLNVFIRDIGQVLNVALQFWFWLTPIVYMLEIVPEKYHGLIVLNPMAGITMGYHNVLLYDKAPDVSLLIYPSIFALVSLSLAMVVFRKASEEMADVL